MASRDCRCPSGEIARHLGSEATLIRRIMARLTQAGLLEVREGRDGGYKLKRDPESITCADVFRILQVGETTGLLDSTSEHSPGLCMQVFFIELSEEMDRSVCSVLEKYTIARLAQQANTSRPAEKHK